MIVITNSLYGGVYQPSCLAPLDIPKGLQSIDGHHFRIGPNIKKWKRRWEEGGKGRGRKGRLGGGGGGGGGGGEWDVD